MKNSKGQYVKVLLWGRKGKPETTECNNHNYAWSGHMPCTGLYRCVYCGKVNEDS